MPRQKVMKPKKAKKHESRGPYICALCNKGFTRRATVKEPHFASCVAKHGNPNHVVWDAHESCWAKRPGRKVGPSGVATPDLERMALKEEKGGDGVDLEQDVRSSSELQAKDWDRMS